MKAAFWSSFIPVDAAFGVLTVRYHACKSKTNLVICNPPTNP
jgi:hypothetical protein